MDQPSTQGSERTEVTLQGLIKTVSIIYDLWGIPHIRARTREDLFFANGYAHAADRLWQMDALRRRAAGRMAEWMGSQAVAADALMRRFDLISLARDNYAGLAPETQAMCESYASGVNAFIAQGKLPVEYQLLEDAPEPWEPWHCIVAMRQNGLLMGSIWFKLWRAAALGTIGAEHLGLLRYDDGGPERFVVPQGGVDEKGRWVAALDDLRPAMEGLSRLFAESGTSGGSNNWVLSGERTASGFPLIAGDPHRPYDIPSLYYQIHLQGAGVDALGLSVPGVPGMPHFGHNEHVAWCVTFSFADTHDLYIEDFSGLPHGQYRTADGTQAATHRRETIKVRGGDDVVIDAWDTRHGPVIVGGPDAGFGLALKSMHLQRDDRSFDCLPGMLEATTLTSFYDLMAPWGLIDHNLVGADRAGGTGILIRARVPIRDRINGWLPVPGWTDDHKWRGFIPFAQMPRQENVEGGLIATANSRPVPDNWLYYFCTDCHPTTRANRIYALLNGKVNQTPDDMLRLLYDCHSAPAAAMAGRILRVAGASQSGVRLQAILDGWNGNMAPNLLAPTVYTLMRHAMARIVVRRSGLQAAADMDLTSVPPGVSPFTHMWWTIPELLRREDTSLLGGATWDAVILEALENVGRDFKPLVWGEAHLPLFLHPLSATFPDQAALLNPSSRYVGGDADCLLATGALPQTGTAAIHGPVAKYIWDLSDWDKCSWIVFHGASGNPESPHFRDQNERWARGELVSAWFSEAKIRANATHTLVLLP